MTLSDRNKTCLKAALPVLCGYLLLYVLGRLIWVDFSQASAWDWLFLAKPTGLHSYLYGWLLSSSLFWYAMGISVIPALFGKKRFGLATLVAFAAGMVLGILFGPCPEGEALGHGHYGWAIWGVVFLLGMAGGILLERRAAKKGAK